MVVLAILLQPFVVPVTEYIVVVVGLTVIEAHVPSLLLQI